MTRARHPNTGSHFQIPLDGALKTNPGMGFVYKDGDLNRKYANLSAVEVGCEGEGCMPVATGTWRYTHTITLALTRSHDHSTGARWSFTLLGLPLGTTSGSSTRPWQDPNSSPIPTPNINDSPQEGRLSL